MNRNTWNGWKHSTVGQWVHGVSLGLMLWMVLIAPTQVLAAPTGAQVVQGNVNIQQSGSTTNITASNKAIINYQKFNIAANETVRFIQPNSSARVLNRVVGKDPSKLLGNLQANGIVYLVNPAGVYFGQNSVIDAADFRAAAGRISNQDFLAGMDRFQLTGELVNDGTITASAVTLLGRQVTNSGTIVARQGAVTLAAGEGTIVLTGDGRYVVEVAEAAPDARPVDAEAAVVNEGEIRASRMVSLFSAGDTFSLAVKQKETGTIAAPEVAVTAEQGSVQIEGGMDAGYEGQIIIWAEGVTQMSGTLLADGGFVEVSGKAGVELDGTVMTGPAGTLLIDPTVVYITSQNPGPDDFTPVQIDQMLNKNGTVTIQADELIEVQETISSAAPGLLTLLATDPVNGVIRLSYEAGIELSGGASLVLDAGSAIRGGGYNTLSTTGAGTITLVGNASRAGVAGVEMELYGGVSFSQGSISTDSGAISITGNGLQTEPRMDGADGVFLDGGAIVSNQSGDITITGRGHSASVSDYEARGVVLEGETDSLTVSSFGGSVTIDGTGGLSRNNAQGVFIEGDAAVGSGNAVTITGQGGTIDASTGGFDEYDVEGVMIDNYSGETKSKVIAGAGGITIDGTGGGFTNLPSESTESWVSGGVGLEGASLTTTGGGSIAIHGYVDNPLVQTQAEGAYGVNIMSSQLGAEVGETTPEACAITITGTGGGALTGNAGVIFGDVDGEVTEPTLINTAGGDVLIRSPMGGVVIASTQMNTSGGNVTLTGTGGNGSPGSDMGVTDTPQYGEVSFGNGVQIFGGTTIAAGAGNVTITGQGAGTALAPVPGTVPAMGVVINSEGMMTMAPISIAGQNVTINGTGGQSRDTAQGVRIADDVAVAAGNAVTITGQGGTLDASAASTDELEDKVEGVAISYGEINTSRVIAGAGGITIEGTGGGYINRPVMPTDSSFSGGVDLDGASLTTTGGGAITITGYVDNSLVQTQTDGAGGVNIINSQLGVDPLETTPQACTVTITGTAAGGQIGNVGVMFGTVDGGPIAPTLINTAGGDVQISSMMGGVGLVSTQINTSGGNVTLTGTGGTGAISGNMVTDTPMDGDPSFGSGVQIFGGTTIAAGAGNVTITGQGAGTAIAPVPGTVPANGVLIDSETVVSMDPISISGQNVTITGTGGVSHSDAAGVQALDEYTITAAANVTIDGTGGTYVYTDDQMMSPDGLSVAGVYMNTDVMTQDGYSITATNGDVRIDGMGGYGDFSAAGPMDMVSYADAMGTELTDVRCSAGGEIVLTGMGGTTFGSAKGVDVEGEFAFSAGTNVKIAGTGGTYVYIASEVGGGEVGGGEMVVSGPSDGGASTTGVSFYNYTSETGGYDVTATGDVTITGTGGSADYSGVTGPLTNYQGVDADGIELDGTEFQAGGGIAMQGTGGDSSGDVIGVDMTGFLEAAGDVTITGTGGNLSCYGQPSFEEIDDGFEVGGVLLEGQSMQPTELVVDAGGNVVLTGQGGSIDMSGLIVQASPDAVDFAIGVELAAGLVQASGNVTATGTGGTIDLTGMSPSGEPLDHELRVQGVWVDEQAAIDTSAGPGAIPLGGTGGTVNIDSAVGDTFVGEVGIEGVEIRGLVKSSTGAILMLGQGGRIEADGLPIDPADPNLADMRWRGMNLEGQVVSTMGDVILSGVAGDWLGDVAGVGLVGSPMPMSISTGGTVNIGGTSAVGNGGGTVSGSEILFSDTLAIADASTLTLNGVAIFAGDVVGPQGTLQLNGPDDATATLYLMGDVTLDAVGSGPGAYSLYFVKNTTVVQHATFKHTGELVLGVEATPATIDFQNGFTYAGVPTYNKEVEDIVLGLIDETLTIVVLPGQTITSLGLDDDGNIKVITGSGGRFIVTGGAIPGAQMTLLGSGDTTVQGPVDGTTIILGGSGERTFDQPVVDTILTDLGGNYDARFAGGSNFANPEAVLLGTTGSVDFGTDVVFVAGLSVPAGTVVIGGTLDGGTGGVEVGGLDMAGDTTILGQGDIAVAGQLTGLADLVIVSQGDVLLQPTDTSEPVRSVFVEGVNIMSYGTDTLGGDQTYICSPDGSLTFHSTYDVGGGDFIMDTSRALPPALASAFKSGGDLIILNANNFTMTGNDKLTVGGNLEINAMGIASLGDINALGSILVNAGSIVLLERDAGMVQLPDGSFVMDFGLDFAAGGTITINGLTTGQSPQMNENLAMGSGDLFSPDGFAFDLAVLVPDPPKPGPGPDPDIETPEVLIYDESTIQQEAAESEITRLGDEVADDDGEGDEVVTDSNVTLTAAEVKAVLDELGIDVSKLTTPASRAAAKQMVALYWTVFVQSGETADIASVEKRNDGRINEVLAAALKNAGNLKSMDALQLKKALLARGQSSAIVMEYLASLYQTINAVELPAKKGYRMKWALASRIAPSGVNSRTLMQAIETSPVAKGQPERLKSLKKTLANNTAPTGPVAMVN